MLNIKGMRTFALATTKPEAAERFYTEVLGGTVVSRITHPAGKLTVREVFIQVGDVQIALAQTEEGVPPPGVPHHTLVLDHMSKDDLRAELEAQGVEIEVIRDHRNATSYSCYVYDPDGNRFELWVGPKPE